MRIYFVVIYYEIRRTFVSMFAIIYTGFPVLNSSILIRYAEKNHAHWTKLHATKCHIIYTPLNRPFSRLDNLNFIFFKSFFKTRQMLRVYNNLVSDRAHSHFTLCSTFFYYLDFWFQTLFYNWLKSFCCLIWFHSLHFMRFFTINNEITME